MIPAQDVATALPIPVLTTESEPGSVHLVQSYWTMWGEGRDMAQAMSALSRNAHAQGAHVVVAVRACTTIMKSSGGSTYRTETDEIRYSAYGTAIRYAM